MDSSYQDAINPGQKRAPGEMTNRAPSVWASALAWAAGPIVPPKSPVELGVLYCAKTAAARGRQRAGRTPGNSSRVGALERPLHLRGPHSAVAVPSPGFAWQTRLLPAVHLPLRQRITAILRLQTHIHGPCCSHLVNIVLDTRSSGFYVCLLLSGLTNSFLLLSSSLFCCL